MTLQKVKLQLSDAINYIMKSIFVILTQQLTTQIMTQQLTPYNLVIITLLFSLP